MAFIRVIIGVSRGPEGTSFEDGVFVVQLVFPMDYPMSPPKMKFVSEIFHPNGNYCYHIWSDCHVKMFLMCSVSRW